MPPTSRRRKRPVADFPLFPKLPVELRLIVWYFAFELEKKEHPENRIIEFHSCNVRPRIKTVSVSISKPYPAIFHANQESRIEALKTYGGEMVPLHPKKGFSFTDRTKSGRIYINFDRDVVFLSNRFYEIVPSQDLNEVPQRLAELFQILPRQAVLNIQMLVVAITKSIFQHDHPWDGDFLDLYCPGALRSISLVSTNPFEGYRLRRTVNAYVTYLWQQKRDAEIAGLQQHGRTDGSLDTGSPPTISLMTSGKNCVRLIGLKG